MKSAWLILLLLGFVAFTGAATTNLGSWEGSLLRMGAGARELALGNAGLADSAAQPAAYWNPATLPLLRGSSLSLSGDRRALDRAGGALGFGKSVGSRMGAGLAVLWRGDLNFKVIDEEDRDLGTAMPWTGWAAVAVGWRLTRASGIGASLGYYQEDWNVASKFSDVDMVDEHSSSAALTVGWHQEMGRFAFAVVARNIGFGSNASVGWTRTTSRDNSLWPSRGVIPKSLEAGSLYRTHVMGRSFAMRIEVIDYQLADTLAAFDPDLHVLRARMGAEWLAFQDGAVRLGWDDGTWSAGAGYLFHPRLGKRRVPLQVDYALFLEREAGFSPFAFGSTLRF